MGNKTSKKDFELFKKECRKWIKVFGLLDWGIGFAWNQDMPSDRAWLSADYNGKLATFGLTIDWSNKYNPISKATIKLCAYHEVMELLIARLVSIARTRYVTECEIDEASHDIIRTLENVVYPKFK